MRIDRYLCDLNFDSAIKSVWILGLSALPECLGSGTYPCPLAIESAGAISAREMARAVELSSDIGYPPAFL
jgi:hypothetical protein